MDDLLDLSFSSTPLPPPPPSLRPASGSGTRTPSVGGGSNNNTAFDLLASASSTGNGQGYGGFNGPSRNGTPSLRPNSTQGPSGKPNIPSKTSSSNDAFSSLLSFPTLANPSSSSSVNTSTSSNFNPKTRHLSMAEQAMKKQTMEKEKEKRERSMFDFGQLGGMEGSSSSSSSSSSSHSSKKTAIPMKVQVPSSKFHGGNLPPIRLNGMISVTTPQPTVEPSRKEKMTLEDFDDVWESPPSTNRFDPPSMTNVSNGGGNRIRSEINVFSNVNEESKNVKVKDPWDFDELSSSIPVNGFTNGGGGGMIEGEEDVLGMLGKPVDHFVVQKQQSMDNHGKESKEWKSKSNSPRSSSPPHPDQTNPSSSSTTSTSHSRTSPHRNSRRNTSPPPHILGRIVEMGFSVDQARRALETTKGGLDVEAALEVLLAGGGEFGGVSRGRLEDDERDKEREREREAEKRRRRRNGPSRETISMEPSGSGSGSGTATPLGIDADKLLIQATELGKGFLGKASGLWSVGKERAMKVYEERTVVVGGGLVREGNGRPKWMVDHPVDEDEGRFEGENGKMRSSSNKEEEELGRGNWDDDAILSGRKSTPRSNPPQDVGRESRQSSIERNSTSLNTNAELSVKEKTAALFKDDPPGYRSSGRRRPGSGRETPRTSTPTMSHTPIRPRSPLRSRPIIQVTPQQIATCANHKTIGNDRFKLGMFSEAVMAYSRAIDVLPDGHLLRIPLHNNRATAYLRSGGHHEAIQDCTIVIEVIGVEYHPAKEQPLPSDLQEVKLGESLVKALNKRATGHEMAEKWEFAKADWERLVRVLGGGVGVELGAERVMKERALAMEGLGRCKKMQEVLTGAMKPATAISRKSSKPPTRSSTPANPDSSVAVSRLRLAAEAQDKEDTLRLGLKDATDARLLAWSAGKETNLRGLLSSLDSVLGGDEGWKALGIKKLGMADLVTDKQVKLGYMKVIGKVHPDKLNTTTTTLEQRMIANGVFGRLNEAWHAFQR